MNDFKTTFDKNKLWQYYHHLIWADKLSQSTVKRKLAGLKKFCQWAAGKGLIEKNPFEESKEGEMKPPPARRLGVSVLGSASFLPASSASTEAGGIRRREIKQIRPIRLIGKIGIILGSLLISLGILKISLTKFPSPPPVPQPPPLLSTSLQSQQVLSQTAGFGEKIREIGEIREIGIGKEISASGSAILKQLASQGQLVLPESLGIEAKEIALKTTEAYEGNLTLNPDGQGIINLLFEGSSPKEATGGFLNIQNANLTEGNLIAAQVPNEQTGFNFLQFQGGTDLTDRFTVDGQGNVKMVGKLTLDSGQITSAKNLIFSPQEQPTLILAPKQSLLKSNLAIAGQIYDGGLGIFGTTGERLPQTFDFTQELTVEFEFLTGNRSLTIKFNLNKDQTKYYQAVWQTDSPFAIQACNPNCTTIGSTAYYPFEEFSWHHGRLKIKDDYLTWELDLSAQKVTVPVQVKDIPLLSQGYLQFSQNFAAIANLKISQGGEPILTSGHGRVGGNLEVAGSVRVGQLSSLAASTHICRNALGELAECAADLAEWYPVSLREEADGNGLKTDLSGLEGNIAGTLVSIINIPNPVDDPTARYLAQLSKIPYDRNILGVLADPTLGANGKKLAENYQPLVLAGRVAVKVSDINGAIEIGEAITSSAIPGVGMKATKGGMVVGTALEKFNEENSQTCPQPFNNLTIQPSTPETEMVKWLNGQMAKNSSRCGFILVLINPGWWEPEEKEKWEVGSGKLDDEVRSEKLGNQEIPPQNQEPPASRISLQTSQFAKILNNETMEQWSNEAIEFNSLLVERLRTAGQAEIADQLIAQTLKVEGEATVAGQLMAASLETENASIAYLKAKEIESETITSLENKFGNLLAKLEKLEEKEKGESETANPSPHPNLNPPEESTSSALLAQIDQFIKELEETALTSLTKDVTSDINVSEDIEIGETGYEIRDNEENKSSHLSPITYHLSHFPYHLSLPSLTVTGPTSLGQTTVAGNLLVDSSLQIGANSINSLDNTLYLQNYGFGEVDILAGKIKIDKLGNLSVAGNVEVEKDLKVKRSLFASLIKPIDKVITIEGDLKTTGSGTFNKIVIAQAKTEASVFPNPSGLESSTRRVFPAEVSSTSAVENSVTSPNSAPSVITNATAGTAVLPAGETELTIVNETITNDSLIYLTPLSPTENKVLFVKAKKATTPCPSPTPEILLENLSENPDNILSPSPLIQDTNCSGYFTIGIDEAITQDINFDWWVIN